MRPTRSPRAEALTLAAGEGDERIATLNRLVAAADDKALALAQALSEDAVKVQGEQVLIVASDGSTTDAVTGAAATPTETAEDAVVNNRLRGALETALATRALFGTDATLQREPPACCSAGRSMRLMPASCRWWTRPWPARWTPRPENCLEQARAAMQLASDDEAQRLAAAQTLGNMGQPALRPLLAAQLEAESSSSVKAALSAAIASLDRSLAVSSALSQAFTGLSLGSILLLGALGLAITYGLMGVINMAHGELIMIGAYATWAVQVFFKNALPGLFDWYLLAALPVAFVTAALVGAAMERTVIRFLYGRPLETLLATWGISLVLMQGVRSLFGAQNVGVENPSWMSGSITVLGKPDAAVEPHHHRGLCRWRCCWA